VVVKPLAKVPDTEQQPHLVEAREDGPIRCKRCKCYMCPGFGFIDGGRRFQCHLCCAITDTPHNYFSHVDHQNQRQDKYQRAELCQGSYEFPATIQYCKDNKWPNAPAFIFAIDVSYNSVKSGMVELLCRNLLELIENLPKDSHEEASSMKVGFLTYSNVIHFYNLNKSLDQPKQMVVGDVNDIFVPLQDGFLVDVNESKHVITTLLEQIPELFRDCRETELLYLPVVQAAVQALTGSNRAGKLMMFHSGIPSAQAPGKLKPQRDDRKLIGTDKERTLFQPVGGVYADIGKDCVAASCSVDLYLFNSQYCDVATLSHVPSVSGGDVYKYTMFRPEIDGQRFIKDLTHNIKKNVVFDAVMRVRTSTGIRAVGFMGNHHMTNTQDVELASIDEDKCITVTIKHDDKITEDQGAHLQVALLYTSVSGQRRLRIHNLSLSVCTTPHDLYRSCETDAIMNYSLKRTIMMGLDKPQSKIREELIQNFCTVLAIYRKKVAQPQPLGQLILPECMKLVPCYLNCLLKYDGINAGQAISTDEKAYMRNMIMSKDCSTTQAVLYPQVIPVNGDLQQGGLPASIRCSYERLDNGQMYLMHNSVNLYVWVGRNCDPQVLNNVFGCSDVMKINTDVGSLPEYDNEDSKKINYLVRTVQKQVTKQMKLLIIRQGDQSEGPMFKRHLAEDRTPNSSSYVDFLCHMHKEIRNLLS